MDSPRTRYPAGERSGRGRGANSGRADESRRDAFGNERGNARDSSFQDRQDRQDRGGRFGRREQRPSSPQSLQRRTIHYQVVTMEAEEWGDALENRLNALGHDGWRLVAIDEGRQYVFVQSD